MTDNDDKDKRGSDERPPRRTDGERKPYAPRGDKPFTPRGDRPARDGDRPRSFAPRGDKPYAPRGDKPFTPRGDRPARDGDRPPRRDFGDRPPRRDGDGERPRSFAPRGDKPYAPRGDKPFTPRGDRPARDGDRPPRRDFGDRPPRRDGDGERPRSFAPRGDKPYAPRGDKPFAPRGDRPARDGDRPPRRDFSDRTPRRDGDGERPRSFRPREERVEAAAADDGNRIAKVIARAGLCSRRDAEVWIEAGRVAVNGRVITSPALDVTDEDKILVDGVPLPARERTRLWLYHKPKGLETTEHSPEGRPTVFDNLPAGLPRVLSVGRLDINTEGLLLLTNDGGLARVLAHPKTAWLRRYRVRVYGPVDQARLDTLRDGITIEDPEDGEVTYAPIVAKIERSRGDNSWLSMDLREGKNREIKKVLEHFGLSVTRLIRISFGPFQLGDMPEGTAEEIKGRYLRDQLGEKLAAEAEVDFESPIFEHVAQVLDAPKKPRQDDRPDPRQNDRRDDWREDRPRRDDRDDRPKFAGRGSRDEPKVEYEPERGSPQDREGRSKTAWSAEPLPERRRDSKKPGQKRDAAMLGARPDLKVTREKVEDRKGRAIKVERVVKLPPPEPQEDITPRFERDGERPRFEGYGKPRMGGPRAGFRPREDGDRPRSFAPRGDKPFTPRGDRPARDGDRPPRRDFGDRPPRRDFGDRPPRRDDDGGERKSFAPRGERPAFRPREDGDRKPFRPREDGDRPRSFAPRGDRPARDGDRPFTPRGDRPARDGDRPFTPRGDRPPRRDDDGGERKSFAPRGERPAFRPREDGDRPRSFAPRGDKPFTPHGDRPARDGDRPFKPRGDRPFGDKPAGGRSFGKPGGRAGGGKPGGYKSGGFKPGGPGGRPGGGKPRGPGGGGPRGGGADRRG